MLEVVENNGPCPSKKKKEGNTMHIAETKRWRMSREIQTACQRQMQQRDEGNEDVTFRQGIFSIYHEIYSFGT